MNNESKAQSRDEERALLHGRGYESESSTQLPVNAALDSAAQAAELVVVAANISASPKRRLEALIAGARDMRSWYAPPSPRGRPRHTPFHDQSKALRRPGRAKWVLEVVLALRDVLAIDLDAIEDLRPLPGSSWASMIVDLEAWFAIPTNLVPSGVLRAESVEANRAAADERIAAALHERSITAAVLAGEDL